MDKDMIKVMSCNVRVAHADDGADNWIHRQDYCIAVISNEKPDLVGFQEATRVQFDDLARGLPGFKYYGLADTPAGNEPRNVIFYREERFDLIEASGYWLSEKPHVAGSRSWDSSCIRLANWVRLRERNTLQELRFVNTHLDHVGQMARENQARLLVEDAACYPEEYRQILSGDFNCDQTNKAIALLEQGGWRDTHAAIHGPAEPGFTFHAFEGKGHVTTLGKIDWIFSRGPLEVTTAKILRDPEPESGRYPSDHYFLSTTLKL